MTRGVNKKMDSKTVRKSLRVLKKFNVISEGERQRMWLDYEIATNINEKQKKFQYK